MEMTPYRESLSRLRKGIRAYEAGDEEALNQGFSDFLGSLPVEDLDRGVRASGISSMSRGERYPLPAPGLDGMALASLALEEGTNVRGVACPSYWAFSRELDFPNGLSVKVRKKEDIIGHPYGKVVFFRWGRNMYAFHSLHDFEGDLSRTHEKRWHTHIERAVGWDIEEIGPEPPKNPQAGRDIWRKPVHQRLSIRAPRRESAIDITYRTFRRGTESRNITAWRLEAGTSGDYDAPLVAMMMGYVGGRASASPDRLPEAIAAIPPGLLSTLPRRLESFEDFLTG